MTPDGQFPNVTKTPNPEVPESHGPGRAGGARAAAPTWSLATDPDADRLGGLACTRPDGKGDYRFLTGNEIAALLTHFKLSQLAAAGPTAGVADRRHDRGDDRA